MGCGKSKHDVASGNTVLKRKQSSVKSNKDQEIGTQTKDDSNSKTNNANVNSEVEVQKDGGDDNVVEEVVRGKVDDVGETLLQEKNDVVAVAGESNANEGEEKVLEKNEVVSGGENANEVEEKVVEEKKEEVIGVVADEKTDVEEVKEEDGLVLKEVSEKSQVVEEGDALKANENDQKVNDDAPVVVAEENKNGGGKDDVSAKEEIVAKEEAPEDIINVAAPEIEEKDLKAEEQKENNLGNEEDVKEN